MTQQGAQAFVIAAITAETREDKTVQISVRRDASKASQKIVGGAGKGNTQGPGHEQPHRHSSEAKGLAEGKKEGEWGGEKTECQRGGDSGKRS